MRAGATRRLLLAGLTALAVSGPVAVTVAVATGPDTGTDAGSNAAVDTRPDRGSAQLDFLTGAWMGAIQHPDGKGGWSTVEETRFTFRRTMGDHYVEGEAKAGGYLYRLLFSFDRAQTRFRIVAHDDVSGLVDVYEGNVDPAGRLVVSNVGPGTFYLAGERRIHNRMIFEQVAKGWTWMVDASADKGGVWQPQMRVLVRPADAGAGNQ